MTIFSVYILLYYIYIFRFIYKSFALKCTTWSWPEAKGLNPASPPATPPDFSPPAGGAEISQRTLLVSLLVKVKHCLPLASLGIEAWRRKTRPPLSRLASLLELLWHLCAISEWIVCVCVVHTLRAATLRQEQQNA